jgi:hypothetical protein
MSEAKPLVFTPALENNHFYMVAWLYELEFWSSIAPKAYQDRAIKIGRILADAYNMPIEEYVVSNSSQFIRYYISKTSNGAELSMVLSSVSVSDRLPRPLCLTGYIPVIDEYLYRAREFMQKTEPSIRGFEFRYTIGSSPTWMDNAQACLRLEDEFHFGRSAFDKLGVEMRQKALLTKGFE